MFNFFFALMTLKINFFIHFIAIICTVYPLQGRSYSDEESDEEEEAPAEGEKKTQ